MLRNIRKAVRPTSRAGWAPMSTSGRAYTYFDDLEVKDNVCIGESAAPHIRYSGYLQR